MASDKLVDFLTDLSESNEKVEEFKNNPEKVMDDASLSDKEKEIVLSGDPEKIRSAMLGGNAVFGTTVVVVVVIVL